MEWNMIQLEIKLLMILYAYTLIYLFLLRSLWLFSLDDIIMKAVSL